MCLSSCLPAGRCAGVPGVWTHEETAADRSNLHGTGGWGTRTAPNIFPYTETVYSLKIASTAWMCVLCRIFQQAAGRKQEELLRLAATGTRPTLTIHRDNLMDNFSRQTCLGQTPQRTPDMKKFSFCRGPV